MRVLPFIFLTVAGSLAAGEPGSAAYPLWNGHESVAEYARRVNLPATQTLDLGNNVKLELALIPAGQFTMGTPEPTPVDEDGFRKKIVTGQALLAVSAGALLVMLAIVALRAIRQKRRPQLSLGLLLLVTVAAGGGVLSGVHWRQSVRGLERARVDFIAAKARYDAAEDAEKPGHSVTLTQPFYMGKFPVTQDQYQAVTSAHPGRFMWKLLEKDASKKSIQQSIGRNRIQFKGNDIPVESVSWGDAQTFCSSITARRGQPVRLPTEAEWEYACRAGTTTAYYSGDTPADYARVTWYAGNGAKPSKTVGQYEPNAFELYDMFGYWQWCQDWFGDYDGSAATDPQGPALGDFRVIRGGSSCVIADFCRSARRDHASPMSSLFNRGFRVVLPAPAARTP